MDFKMNYQTCITPSLNSEITEDRLIENLIAHNQLLTANQVAKMAQVSVKAVYKWAKTYRIRCLRLGKLVRFAPEDVQEFLSKSRIH